MTKEELEKEAREYVCERNPLVTKKWFIDAFKKYDKGEKVKYLKDCEIAEYESYLASAEPREKRIAELEEAKANLEYLLEGKDNEIDELKKENKVLEQNLEDTEICENGWKNRVKDLEAQIEKKNELINRYYEVCVQIPKEYRTMVFDSCLEDTRQLRR